MKIFEVDSSSSSPGIDTGKLFQLANFLMNRAKDTASAAEINKETFLKLASNMGVSIGNDQLVELINTAPLNGVLEPINPNDRVIKFKGSEPDVAMPDPNQAQEIVANAAKSAMKKSRGV